MLNRDFKRGRREWNRQEDRFYNRENRADVDRETYERYHTSRQYNDWRTPGPFTGIGPKGYRRKDERILDEVNERLTLHGQVDASNISVGVSEGTVTLSGQVSSRQEKHIAEYVAESVSGVRDVQNNLRILRAEEQRSQWKAPGESAAPGWAASGGDQDRDQEPSQSDERDLVSSSLSDTGISTTRGQRGSNVSGQIQGGMPATDGNAGGTSSMTGPTGGLMPVDAAGGTEGRHEPPDELRGEGMTPIPDENAATRPPVQFEAVQHETPRGEPVEWTGSGSAEMKQADSMDEDEPRPVGRPPAIASGPIDIEAGQSGSTLGDEEEEESWQMGRIPQTGTTSPGSVAQERDIFAEIQPGMVVMGRDGQEVGRVKEVRSTDFLLDRPMARDMYVPLYVCERVEDDRVLLSVTSDAIAQQGWASPPLM